MDIGPLLTVDYAIQNDRIGILGDGMINEKTFWMKTPRSFLGKLDWDIEQLRPLDKVLDAFPYTYQTINCAVTAWSMVDWVFDTLSATQRMALGLNEKVSSFKKHVQAESTALAVCREIADASKHKRVDHSPSPTIGTPVVDVWEGADGEYAFSFPIVDGELALDSLAVMIEARAYWVEFFEKHNL